MDIVTFLRARLADDRAVVDRLENLYPSNRWTRERDEIEAKEKILELHEQWPVLVERQVAPEPIEWGADNLSFRASRELLWMTEESYLRTFGERPPTDAIVRAMAHPYRHDPDFNPEWSIA